MEVETTTQHVKLLDIALERYNVSVTLCSLGVVKFVDKSTRLQLHAASNFREATVWTSAYRKGFNAAKRQF